MKKQDTQQRVGVGVSSVLMILVVLAMTALSLLAFGSARSNESMTRRNADIGASYYLAADQAQRKLAEIDAVLLKGQAEAADILWYEDNSPEGVTWEESMEGITFSFSVETDYQQAVTMQGLVTEGPQRYCIIAHQVMDNAAEMEEDYFLLMGD